MKTIHELNEEQRNLIENLSNIKGEEEREKVFLKIRELKVQIAENRRVQAIERINAKQSRLRELAKLAFDIEEVTDEKILCNDGSFHSVKVKKYPKIAALKYTRGKFEGGKLTQLTLNGEKFYLYQTKYEYGKETEYIKPANFEEFLRLNSIMSEDMTLNKLNSVESRLNELKQNLEKAMEEYKKGFNDLEGSNLQYYGFLSQSNENLYTYRVQD